MKKGTVNKSVRIPDSLWRQAKEKAREEGYTMEGLIRNLLTEYLKKGGK